MSPSINLPSPEYRTELAAAYSTRPCIVLSKFLELACAGDLEVHSREWPWRNVYVDQEQSATWMEYNPPNPATVMDGLFYSDNFKGLICEITGLTGIDNAQTRVWVNRYGPGDAVPLHRDIEGDAQVVICLRALESSDEGGELVIAEQSYRLQAGDAVLFHARKLSHRMERIGTSQLSKSPPARVTCIVRMFDTRRSLMTGRYWIRGEHSFAQFLCLHSNGAVSHYARNRCVPGCADLSHLTWDIMIDTVLFTNQRTTDTTIYRIISEQPGDVQLKYCSGEKILGADSCHRATQT